MIFSFEFAYQRVKLLKAGRYYYGDHKKAQRPSTENTEKIRGWPFCAFLWLHLDRQDHRHILLIVPVLIAVSINQILLFKLYRDEDVGSRGDGKHEMR